MQGVRVRWPDLRQGLTLETGQTHRIVVERVTVARLEIEDEHFNAASAVLLPDVPARGVVGRAQAVDFSDDDRWGELLASHEAFAKALRDRPFHPERVGDGADRHPGLGVIVAALRFLDEHPGHRLLVAGHTDRSGDAAYNQRLSAARARSVLAVLEGDRGAFVAACREFHAGDDDGGVLRYVAREHGWPCDPGAAGGAPPRQAVEAFQRTYNDRFSRPIAVDGVAGDETRGAYFDVYQQDLASMAGGHTDLEGLRAQLRFVSAEQKVLACGERYPIENPATDGYRSQQNRRVELLFFAPPDIPDPFDERTPGLLYRRNLFRFEVLDRGDLPLPTLTEGDSDAQTFAIVDAPAPEPGVGDPEEPFETHMPSLGERDVGDPWAFLEPFDATQPAAGRQSFDWEG